MYMYNVHHVVKERVASIQFQLNFIIPMTIKQAQSSHQKCTEGLLARGYLWLTLQQHIPNLYHSCSKEEGVLVMVSLSKFLIVRTQAFQVPKKKN